MVKEEYLSSMYLKSSAYPKPDVIFTAYNFTYVDLINRCPNIAHKAKSPLHECNRDFTGGEKMIFFRKLFAYLFYPY